MNTKIILWTCILLYICITTTQDIKLPEATLYAHSEQLYALMKKEIDLTSQKENLTRQIRPKHTISLSETLDTILSMGVVAGPALAVNYLNKSATPSEFQNAVNIASLGIAGLTTALTVGSLTKKAGRAAYDVFTYESGQQIIKLRIEETSKKIAETQQAIATIVAAYPEVIDTTRLSQQDRYIFDEFLILYKKNPFIINEAEPTITLSEEVYGIQDIITLAKNNKANLIAKLYSLKTSKYNHRSSSLLTSADDLLQLSILFGAALFPVAVLSGKTNVKLKDFDNLTQLSVFAAFMLAPVIILSELFDTKEKTQARTITEIDFISRIIKRLEMIAS